MRQPSCNISIPAYASAAIDALEAAGFESWLVGGCVRDALLGRTVNDYDIATAARWEETERVLKEASFEVHRTGTAHGTVTASRDGNPLEITTFRADGTYSDGRHPDSVEFVRHIEDDLARRDFTVNALAYHPERGLLDCWGGIDDLSQGVIRAVGNPEQRFREDALRVLRGCRFASQLGFRIEPATLEAMKATKRGLERISTERIVHELDALLLGQHVHDALMETVDVLDAVLPELAACKGFEQHSPYHKYDVLEHIAWVVQRSPQTRLSRWAALLHDIGKPGAFFMEGERGHFYGHARLSASLASDIAHRLGFSQPFTNKLIVLVREHDTQIEATPKAVKRVLVRLDGDVDLFRALCDLKHADDLAHSELGAKRAALSKDLARVLEEVIRADEAFSLKQLELSGRDVMGLGVSEGPEIGRVLDACLEAVIDERIPNDHERLLVFAGELIGAETQ